MVNGMPPKFCSPAGNDLLFDEGLTEQGRNFSNKIWNAFRLIKSWKVDPELEQPASSAVAAKWFEAMLNRSLDKLDDQFKKYRISDALMIVYKLFWDEFSSWYLEIIKPGYKAPIDKITLDRTISFMEVLLHMLHPFMPFITEEIWQLVNQRETGESLMVSHLPDSEKADKKLIRQFDDLKEIVTNIRNIRKEKNIPQREALKLLIRSSANGSYLEHLDPVIRKLASVSDTASIHEEPAGAVSFIVKNVEYYVPLGDQVDTGVEIDKLENELDYTRGFLKSVRIKLDNKHFVQNAPENVVVMERKKLADAEAKIRVLESQIRKLKSLEA